MMYGKNFEEKRPYILPLFCSSNTPILVFSNLIIKPCNIAHLPVLAWYYCSPVSTFHQNFNKIRLSSFTLIATLNALGC